MNTVETSSVYGVQGKSRRLCINASTVNAVVENLQVNESGGPARFLVAVVVVIIGLSWNICLPMREESPTYDRLGFQNDRARFMREPLTFGHVVKKLITYCLQRSLNRSMRPTCKIRKVLYRS